MLSSKGAVYLSSSLQILRALINYVKAYECGTTDHDQGPSCQFPASADQAFMVFVMVTGQCNRKLSTPTCPIIGFSIRCCLPKVFTADFASTLRLWKSL